MAFKYKPRGRENWYIAFRPGPGQPLKRISTLTSNEKAAEKCLAKVKVELAESRFLDKRTPATMTLKRFAEDLYLPRLSVAKPRSARWRRERWRQVVRVLGEKMTLEQANRIETIELLVAKRLGTGKGKASLATVKQDVAVLRHAIRMAVRWKGETDLSEYRVTEWRPPEDVAPPPKPEPVHPNAWAAILEVARDRARAGGWGNLHGYAVLLLARTTGARRGEILRLRREDVDLRRGVIRRLVLKKRTLGETVETRIQGEALEVLRAIAASHKHELLFCNPETGRQRRDTRAFWDRVRDDAEVHPRYHGIRHAYGRDFLAAGGTTRELQDRLGHSSIRTTEKYSHLAKRREAPLGLPIEMKGATRRATHRRDAAG